ncbi:MAG: DUF4153 domain-containing protein [Planctomycetaceae bacterium]
MATVTETKPSSESSEVPTLDYWKSLNPESPPVRGRELLAVSLLIVLSDLTIYRGQGFAGYGLFFGVAPVLLALGSVSQQRQRVGWFIAVLLWALAARLAWCGSGLAVCCGFAAVVAFAMTLVNRTPFVMAVLAFAGQTVAAGARGLGHYGRSAHGDLRPLKHSSAMSVMMPLTAFGLFGSLFVLANPDLVSSFSHRFGYWLTVINDWLIHFSLVEVAFWIGTAWFFVGLLRPTRAEPTEEPLASSQAAATSQSALAPLYSAYRNTLLTVIGLFAAYLVFEFQSLWFREFPKGFHYSGYAHEGAAWLTFALGLATVMLSLIFRGDILQDERLAKLKRLAWIWSVLNLLLAIAVYHRLCIYIGFNGMTRMRMVGFFGMTAVVVGFGLAVWKIARQRDFVWLFRADLWALAAAFYLYALTPVDVIVMRYNVSRIMAGDPAPSVQISVHPIDAEGLRELRPLLDCRDETIRDGVRALLARREGEMLAEHRRIENEFSAWEKLSAVQLADAALLRELNSDRERLDPFGNHTAREAAWEQFRKYAYQWF